MLKNDGDDMLESDAEISPSYETDEHQVDANLEDVSDSDLPAVNSSDIENDSTLALLDEVEDESKGKKSRRSPMMFIFASISVLMIGVVGGGGYWVLVSSDEGLNPEKKKLTQNSDRIVSMNLPPKSRSKGGGLNAIGSSEIVPLAEGREVQAQVSKKTKVTPAKKVTLNAAAGKARQNIDKGLMFPSVTSVSYQKLPDQAKVSPLAPAPIKQLLELEPFGENNQLPKIGPKGRQAWQVYARPFIKSTENPKVAFIVKGLGFSKAASMAAIKKLPGEVSLAFSPYATNLKDWLLRARLSGHEVFLELPLESMNFPTEDAGPLALSSLQQTNDNMQKLRLVMSKMNGYVGLISDRESKFNQAEGQLLPILKEIKSRGLMFVDGGGGKSQARKIASKIKLPKAFSNVYLDTPPSRRSMDKKLQGLDKMVRQNASAVAVVHAYPNTIERLLIWIKTMEERKLTLVPVSHLANKQLIK